MFFGFWTFNIFEIRGFVAPATLCTLNGLLFIQILRNRVFCIFAICVVCDFFILYIPHSHPTCVHIDIFFYMYMYVFIFSNSLKIKKSSKLTQARLKDLGDQWKFSSKTGGNLSKCTSIYVLRKCTEIGEYIYYELCNQTPKRECENTFIYFLVLPPMWL